MILLQQLLKIFMFIAIAILIADLVTNADGTTKVLNGFSHLLQTGYSAEIAAAGARPARASRARAR